MTCFHDGAAGTGCHQQDEGVGRCPIDQHLAQFAALTNGLVVVVAPLNGIAPIFTVLLAFLFLRRHEQFTYRLVLAILLVVAGVVLVTA